MASCPESDLKHSRVCYVVNLKEFIEFSKILIFQALLRVELKVEEHEYDVLRDEFVETLKDDMRRF